LKKNTERSQNEQGKKTIKNPIGENY